MCTEKLCMRVCTWGRSGLVMSTIEAKTIGLILLVLEIEKKDNNNKIKNTLYIIQSHACLDIPLDAVNFLTQVLRTSLTNALL